MTLTLKEIGFSEYFKDKLSQIKNDNLIVGRVFANHRDRYDIYTEYGELSGKLSGSLYYKLKDSWMLPIAGDWVLIDPIFSENKGIIYEIIPRKNSISRKSAGSKEEEQVVAVNVDYVFIVSSMNQDFNLRRLERYITITTKSSIIPVIILNKSDLCKDVNYYKKEVESIAKGINIHYISCLTNSGIDEILSYFKEGSTIALLGSSGVGKSTIINTLKKESICKTNAVRSDDQKGRHTTTKRELIILPFGGLILDTPGMRALGVWDTESELNKTFKDIKNIAKNCYFSNCTHHNEPDCAVKDAVNKGIIDRSRLQNYFKLKKEIGKSNIKKDNGEYFKYKSNVKKSSKNERYSHKRDLSGF